MLEGVRMWRPRRIWTEAGRIWRSSNGWLKVGLLWMLACNIAQLVVSEIHIWTPGSYNGLKKVAVRKTIAGVNVLGSLVVCIGVWIAVKRAPEPDKTAPGGSDAD
jgi:hypothetical protein